MVELVLPGRISMMNALVPQHCDYWCNCSHGSPGHSDAQPDFQVLMVAASDIARTPLPGPPLLRR